MTSKSHPFSQCQCQCVCGCVCVCKREREREREIMSVKLSGEHLINEVLEIFYIVDTHVRIHMHACTRAQKHTRTHAYLWSTVDVSHLQCSQRLHTNLTFMMETRKRRIFCLFPQVCTIMSLKCFIPFIKIYHTHILYFDRYNIYPSVL